MKSLFLLADIPRNADIQKLKRYITDDLDVKSLQNVWLDPRHEPRAVFLCSSKLELKKIQDRTQDHPLDNKIPFVSKEEETNCIYVEVPSMKCEAIVDKLPWLFHERKNGGSKIKDIKEIKENNFYLSFEDGWDAVQRAVNSTWFIGNTQLEITPFFIGFREKYEMQVQHSSRMFREPVEISLCASSVILALFNLLSLKEKCEEKFPAVKISIYEEKENVSLKGPKSLVEKLEHMMLNHNEMIQMDQDKAFALELFLSCVEDHQMLCNHLDKHNIHLSLEENKKDLEPFVLKDQQKMTFPEFSSSLVVLIKKFSITYSPEMDKAFQEYLRKFNRIHLFFKLKMFSEVSTWSLFQFGFDIDESKQSSVIDDVQTFLKEIYEKMPPVTEELVFHPEYCLTLFKCLLLEKEIQGKFKDFNMTVDEQNGIITLTCPPSNLEKLKKMFVSLYKGKINILEDQDKKFPFELFLKSEKDQQVVHSYFQNHDIHAVLKENEESDLELFVLKDRQEIIFSEFLSSLVVVVQEFSAFNIDKDFHEYLTKFNAKHQFFKLIVSEKNTWNLVQFGFHFNEREKKSVVGNVQGFLKKTELEKTEKDVYIESVLVNIFNLLLVKEKCQEKFPDVKISSDVKTGKVLLMGPRVLVTKLENSIWESSLTIEEDQNKKCALELFLADDKDQQILHYHFQKHNVHVAVEENKENGIELFISHDQQKITFNKFISALVISVQEFSYHYTETTSEMDKAFQTYLTQFNTRELFFKLKKVSEPNKWELYQFGFDIDEEKKSYLVNDIKAFLTQRTKKAKLGPPVPQKHEVNEELLFLPAYCLTLFRCLSLEEKIQKKFKNAKITLDEINGIITLSCTKFVMEKLTKIFSSLYEDISSKEFGASDFAFELFLSNKEDQQLLCCLFQKYKTQAAVEKNGDNLELFVLQDQQKMTFPEFLSSMVLLVQEFPYTKAKPEVDKALLEYLTRFNTEHSFFKLKASGPNIWNLFQLKFDEDESKKKSVLDDVRTFLKKMTEPFQKVFLVNSVLAALFKLMSLKEKSEEKYPDINISIDVTMGKMSVMGTENLVEKLEYMVLDLNKIDFQDEIMMFLEKEVDVRRHFQAHQVFMELEENSGGDILLFVKMKNGEIPSVKLDLTLIRSLVEFLRSLLFYFNQQKKNLQACLSEIVKQVKVFPLPDATFDGLSEFSSKFNDDHTYVKIKATGNEWQLFQFGFNDDTSDVINEIETFLSTDN